MQSLRTLAYNTFCVLWTLLFGLPIVIYFQVRRDPVEIRRVSRVWARGMLWGLRVFVGVTHEIKYHEVQHERPRILAANHQSWWETIAFLIIEPDVCIVAKSSLRKIPIFGWYVQHSPMVLIDREDKLSSLRQVTREAQDAVAQGRSVLIFPEGTRRELFSQQPMEKGVSILYQRLQIPVVPIVHNSGVFQGTGDARNRGGVIRVEYHQEIATGLDRESFQERLQSKLSVEKDRLARDHGASASDGVAD